MTEIERNILLVAAIDIGTTNSGYAISTRVTNKKDPLKIYTNLDLNIYGEHILSLKTPTSLLLNSDQEFHSFGYEAENTYAELVEDDAQDDYYYFNGLTMSYHNNEYGNSDMILEDITGKSVLAIDVFAPIIRELVNHLMNKLNVQRIVVYSNEIRWVLTVPSTWGVDLEPIMRKSAEKAGIKQDNLFVSLDTKAASIFYHQQLMKELNDAESSCTMSNVETQYMIIDLGDDKIDVIVQEPLAGEGTKEIIRTTRGKCGKNSVDAAFVQLLTNIFGEPLLNTMQIDHQLAYVDLMREFEKIERKIKPTNTGFINMTIPYTTLNSLCEQILEKNLTSVVLTSIYSDSIVIRGDKMRIDEKLFKSLFAKTIKRILDLLQEMFERIKMQTVQLLVLVGSFSECVLVQEAIKKTFLTRRVIVLEDSGLAVLKGAVLYGQNRKIFDSGCDEKNHVDISEHFDIQKFDFTKRPPPPLFKDGKISDSAKETCTTIMVGFEMTISQHILFDGDIGTDYLQKTKNAANMLDDIHIHQNLWFSNRHKDMIDRIRNVEELLTAIDNKEHDEIMRIYYRFQHIHTLDDNTSPVDVQVYVEKDRLNSKWLPHIQNAIEKISIAAPGIRFRNTQDSFERSTNYIKIGIDEIDIKSKNDFEILMGEAYTSYKHGYPFIHLGHNRPPASMEGTSIHELLHALGFGHQMQRFEANLYVRVNTDNLSKQNAYQYKQNRVAFTRFDPFSIMMCREDKVIMQRTEEDQIWKLKPGSERSQDLSELDKVALNLMYKPCKSDLEYPYTPAIGETTNMLYCGRDVMQFHNQNVPPTHSSKCGPHIWANCPSCRVFKDVQSYCGKITKILTIKKCLEEGKWQGLSGNFYCGNKYAEEFRTYRFDTCITADGVCGPDQGIPCTDCGKVLKPGYSYKDFNPIPTISNYI